MEYFKYLLDWSLLFGLEPNSEKNILHLAGLEILVRDSESQTLLLYLLLLHQIVSHWTSEPADRRGIIKVSKAD